MSESKQKNIRILIVDDEPDILELMEEELQYNGYVTFKAKSGNEAINFLKGQKVDVVISDFKMPNGDGKVLVEYVTKNFAPQDRPLFYFVSGQADISINEAMAYGIQGFYSKPFDVDQLLLEIDGKLTNK